MISWTRNNNVHSFGIGYMYVAFNFESDKPTDIYIT